MDQAKLEAEGIGFKCRGCGITVMGSSPRKFCTACTRRPGGPIALHDDDESRKAAAARAMLRALKDTIGMMVDIQPHDPNYYRLANARAAIAAAEAAGLGEG